MVLTYNDLQSIFPTVKGIRDVNITFNTVSFYSGFLQKKGLYIPLYNEDSDLKEAINNGAIAAVWNSDITIPTYTPNHFPIFYTNDIWKGIIDMFDFYSGKEAAYLGNQTKTEFVIRKDKIQFTELRTYDLTEIKRLLENEAIMREKGDRK